MLAETADNPHPLWWRCCCYLPLQHGHGVAQAAHTVPAQFHVEVETTAKEVQVVVDKAGHGTSAHKVNSTGTRVCKAHYLRVVSPRRELAIRDSHGGRRGIRPIKG